MHHALATGAGHHVQALATTEPGLYALQASIAALHAQAPTAPQTDWSQIAGLYAELLRRAPTPVAALALAYAEGMADGPDQGLRRLDDLVAEGVLLPSFPRLPATRAELLRRAGRPSEAQAAHAQAIAQTPRPWEREFLVRRAEALVTPEPA